MAEEAVVIEQSQASTQVEQPSPFAGNSWSEQIPQAKPEGQEGHHVAAPQQQTQGAEPAANQSAAAAATAIIEEIAVPKEWLKKEFDIEDPAILKQEREELKKLKETPLTAQEIKFADEQSKHIHELIREGKKKEVLQYLEMQDRIDSIVSSEVTEETASDIIKMGMQIKFKDLTPKEIDHKFNKEFAIPKEPVQLSTETDEEFAVRKETWQAVVDDIKMTKIIEAKLAKPEIEKAKANITLPELSKPEPTANQPSQESLDALRVARENFLQTLENNFTKVEGFSTKVKDELVEIPVAFKIPDEDKVAIKGRLQEGLDVNEYMDKRWFDEKGTPNVEQIMKDIYQLENLDKILSGIATNSANKRLQEYIKLNKNPDLNGKTPQQTFTPNGNAQQVSPFAKGAWSETPPVLNN